MGSPGVPSPSVEEHHKTSLSRKSTASSSKSVKPTHRSAKRAGSGAASAHHHDHHAGGHGTEGRHKRVWKACERCRMKKTKVIELPIYLSSITIVTNKLVTSVMGNSRVNVARMMVLSVLPAYGKRSNTNNYREGTSTYIPVLSNFPSLSLFCFQVRLKSNSMLFIFIFSCSNMFCFLDMPKSLRIHSSLSSQQYTNSIPWCATQSHGI